MIISLLVLGILLPNYKGETGRTSKHPNMDYAILEVLDQNLLEDVALECNRNKELVLRKVYYDGIRLYLQMEGELDQTVKGQIKIECDLQEYHPDLIIPLVEYNESFDETMWLMVFNCIREINVDDLKLKNGDVILSSFSLPNAYVKEIDTDLFFEELDLYSVSFSDTVTLLECRIIADIEGESFQAEIGDIIVTVYVIEQENMDYTFLIPMRLDEQSVFNLISNHEHGVELRIYIDFSAIILEGKNEIYQVTSIE